MSSPTIPSAENAGSAPASRKPVDPIQLPRLYPWIFPISRVAVRAIFTVLGGWRVTGREHVPKTGGLLVASNHLSYADPPAVGLAMRRRCWFMGKSEIFGVPFLAWISRLHLAFPVRREMVDRAAMRRVEELLQAGEAVCVYPEGHVSKTGRLLPLQPGAALFALRTGVPILPTVLINTGRAIVPPKCLPHFVKGGVQVRFGPVIQPEQAPPDLSRRQQAEWLTVEIDRALRALLPPEAQPLPGDERTPGCSAS